MSDEKDKIVAEAHKRFTRISDEQQHMRDVAEKCNKFDAGEQWEECDIKSRDGEGGQGRPRVTINKVSSPVNITANKNAMERARIKVSPFEGTDVDTARVVNGLIRHIQYSEKGNADVAYMQSFRDVCSKSFGALRINTVYLNDESFDQDIVIEKIEDAESVYVDPRGKFAFVTNWMPKEDFEAEYPDAEPVSWDEANNENPFVNGADDICVAEYWVKKETPTKIYKIRLLPDGSLTPESNGLLAEIDAEFNEPKPVDEVLTVTEEQLAEIGVPYEELANRKTKKVEVKQYIIAGNQVLEKNDWAGKYIPIIVIYGQRFKVDGKVFYKSLIYDAIDPQKIYNFYRSQEAEMLMMQPKTPWIGAAGQFVGHEDEWANVHKEPLGYLEYEVVEVNGQPVPPPQRPQPPQVQSGFVQAVSQASDEIKATTGLFDASLGAQGNEKSGKAILARQQQGEMGTYHFTAAFNEALRITGIIIVDLIPKIYDTERTIRVLGEDMREEVVKINGSFIDKSGKQVLYDMTTGCYDVVVETGPALNTRRLDAAENLLQLVQYVPSAGMVTAPFAVKNMDVEYSDEIALHLQAMISPEISDRVEMLKNGGKDNPLRMQNQQLQQQMQQMMQQMQGMQKTLAGMGNENQQLKAQVQNNRLQETQIQSRAKVQTQQIKTQGDIQTEIIRSKAQPQPMPFR